MNIIYRKINCFAFLLFAGLGMLNCHRVHAQVTTMGSAYYLNQYQVNPALAGRVSQGFNFNGIYRQQADDIDGSANIQALTVDYGYNDKMGLGVNLYREDIGLVEATRIMATYAYHVTLSDNQNVHFGLSAGVLDQRIDMGELVGDAGDPMVSAFNDQGMKFDLDFGLTYTWKALTIQAAGLHLAAYTESDESSVSTFRKPVIFGAVSYSLLLVDAGKNSVALTPKACYRKVEDFDNIIDIGAQVGFLNENLNFFTMYHSSQNATFGLGVLLKEMYGLSGMYTTDARDYDGRAGSDYEIALQVLLGHK